MWMGWGFRCGCCKGDGDGDGAERVLFLGGVLGVRGGWGRWVFEWI